MGKVTFEMLVKIDGLKEMDDFQKETLLDEIMGSMNAVQIRAWLVNAKYRDSIFETSIEPT